MTVVMLTGCSYQATVPCEGCGGTQTKTIIGEPNCNRDLAKDNARVECRRLGGVPIDSQITVKDFISLECFFVGPERGSRFVNLATALLKSSPVFAQSAPAAAEDNEPFNCGFTFKITALNLRSEKDYPCRDTRTVRVGYSRINPQTQEVKDVFEDKVVAYDNSDTFECPYAYATRADGTPDPNGTANFVYVIFEGFREEPESKCIRIPLDQGGLSRGLNGQIRNGGVVYIALNPVGAANTFDVEINNPSQTAIPAVKAIDLKPIPDPMFANGR